MQPANWVHTEHNGCKFRFSDHSTIELYSHPVSSLYRLFRWGISVKWKLSIHWKLWLQNPVSVTLLILNRAATQFPLSTVLACSGILVEWKLSTYWKFWLQNPVSVTVVILNCTATQFPLYTVLSCSGISAM